MTRRLLEHDPISGISEFYHYDPTTDEIGLEFVQDTKPILDQNAAIRANGRRKAQGDVWREHWAEIPNSVCLQWAIEDGVWFMQLSRHERTLYLERKLRDSNNAYLKTTEAYL